FTECAAAAGLPNYSLEGLNVAWADYDNDGYLDLYIGLEGEGGIYDKLYRNDGDGTFTEVTSAVGLLGGYTWGVSWADYDNDGDVDLQRFDPSGHAKLYRNDGSSNHWLEVNLIGSDCNKAAIGARLKIVSGGMSQIKEVTGMTGVASQNSLTVELGLGTHTQVDTLEVRWPCGRVERETNIPADQIITRIENWTGVEEQKGSSYLPTILFQNWPNPFIFKTNITFQLPIEDKVILNIYNLIGRLVMPLLNNNRLKGVHTIEWDGKDEAGNKVPTGIYFYRLQVGNFSATKRTILMR
ncbi:MAG: ASPIC/UnbV domain-containing protein, partial [Candidatus Stahlbacteria bacterium]|nr:ASPIC/UnbV domain-containing protein [Candidatus Stahlbacteria bacterium]